MNMRGFFPTLIFTVVCLTVFTFPSLSQEIDCNSGVPQRLEVGGQGQVIPGQTRNRVRTVPGGDQVGFVEVGEIFTVIGGADCLDNISWWQVTTPSGLAGWTAEGVEGDAFLEPVQVDIASGGGGSNLSSIEIEWINYNQINLQLHTRNPSDNAIVPIPNSNSDCTNAIPSNLELGQRVSLDVNPLNISEIYFGHPQGNLYSGIQLLQKIASYNTQRGTTTDDSGYISSYIGFYLLNLWEGRTGFIVSGPECFNGEYLWQIEVDIDDELVSGFRRYWLWVYSDDGLQQFRIIEDQIETLAGFDVQTNTLLPEASVPIISVLEQIGFSYGGGGDSNIIIDDYNLTIPCILRKPSQITYYSDTCITLYPFQQNSPVDVSIIQPDGIVYDTFSALPQPIDIRLFIGFDFSVNSFEPERIEQIVPTAGVHVELPDEVGLMAGVWTIEARQDNNLVSRAYQVFRTSQPTLQTFCDNGKIVIWAGNLLPSTSYNLVLYDFEDIEVRIGGQEITIFDEIGRWDIQTSNDGHALVYSAVQPDVERGVMVLTDVGEEVQSDIVPLNQSFVVNNNRLETSFPIICTAYSSAESPIPLSYNQLYSNRLNISAAFSDDPIDDPNLENYYAFYGQSNQIITIEASSDNVHLELLDPTGERVAAARSSSSGKAIINELMLESNGYYQLIISEIVPVKFSSATAYTLLVTSDDQQIVGYDTLQSYTLETATKQHILSGNEGDTVTVSVTSQDFDPQISLLDSEGEVLIEDDDSADTFLDAQITEFELSEAGLYTIEVSSWNSKQGTYTLEITDE